MKALLFLAAIFIFSPSLLGGGIGGHLGTRNVPPHARTRCVVVFLGFHYDDADPRFRTRLAQGFSQFFRSLDLPSPGAHALRILGKINLEIVAFESVVFGIACAEFVSKAVSYSIHL